MNSMTKTTIISILIISVMIMGDYYCPHCALDLCQKNNNQNEDNAASSIAKSCCSEKPSTEPDKSKHSGCACSEFHDQVDTQQTESVIYLLNGKTDEDHHSAEIFASVDLQGSPSYAIVGRSSPPVSTFTTDFVVLLI